MSENTPDNTAGISTPHSAEAEAALLGAMVLDNEIISDINVTAEYFYAKSSQEIFSTIKQMEAKGEAVDIVTLGEALKSKPEILKIAQAHIIACATPANFRHHQKIVREMAQRRLIYRRCHQVIKNIERDSVEDLSSKLVFDFDTGTFNHKYIKDVSLAVSRQAEKRYNLRNDDQGDQISGVPSGFHDLDTITDGFQGGDLIILGARPGMGKSAIMGQVARHAGQSVGVHIQNLEMTAERQLARMVSDEAQVESWKVRKAMMSKDQWTDFNDALITLGQLLITFDDSSMSLSDIKQSINKAVRNGARLVIVDYIQLVSNPNRSREREVGEVSTTLKQLAKKHNIPIVVIASLNRGLESRENKRPLLSDLRDSGQLEFDADVILFLYRAFVYTKNPEEKMEAELIVAKGRDIGEATIKLIWDAERVRFKGRDM